MKLSNSLSRGQVAKRLNAYFKGRYRFITTPNKNARYLVIPNGAATAGLTKLAKTPLVASPTRITPFLRQIGAPASLVNSLDIAP